MDEVLAEASMAAVARTDCRCAYSVISSWLERRSAYCVSCLDLSSSRLALATALTHALAASARPRETAAISQPVAAPRLLRGSSRAHQRGSMRTGHAARLEFLAMT